ncbi:MAG: TIM barrel protein [Bryobacteraceae bacterium]
MNISRRSLVSASAALVPAASLVPGPTGSLAAAPTAPHRTKLGVSTYSYWHFSKEKYPIEKVIDNAARIGFDGVEILHRQMADETPAYCNKLKRQAFALGLDLYMLSIHQNFVSPDPAVRKQNIDHTIGCIQLAARLGIPCIRLNSGRWGTVKSFDDLMKVKGNEPPLPGYTNDNAFQWCIDSIGECLPAAEKEGVVMALENHWGLTTQPEGVLRIHKAVHSPWLGINMDTGNYPGDPYPEIEKLAPTPPSCRQKPTTAAASGTPSISTTPASPGSCASITSTAGYRSRWKARARPTRPSPRASVSCKRPSTGSPARKP